MATSPTSSAASGAEGSSENDENENKNKDQSNDKLKSTLMDTVLTLERLDVNLFRLVRSIGIATFPVALSLGLGYIT